MNRNLRFLLTCALGYLTQTATAGTHPSMAEVLAASRPTDWRPLDPNDTLYVELPAGRVVIELAGDPDNRHPVPAGIGKAAPEFDTVIWPHMSFTRLPDGDVYAPEVGFSEGFPVARSEKEHLTWLAHCYGMVGVGRDLDAESGSGAEMYVVIGHAPRHLDRNVALVGRVIKGIELLSSLPRGSAEMGFYSKTETGVSLKAIRLASDIPVGERTNLEVIRTDTPLFAALIESRRNRPEDFFKLRAGHIELCNVPIAVRESAPPAPHSP